VDLPTLPYDLDDDLIARTRHDNQPRVRVYRFDHVAVVIGRGGHQDRELRTGNIAADGVPLYKRPGGGCSVVLDPGNVIVSLALPLPGIGRIKSTFTAVSDWIIASLAECGVPHVIQRGVSDLTMNDQKIGGSCVYRTRGLLYYTTTLLCAPDLPLVNRYLMHPPREPDYRQRRPHDQFMGSLAALCDMDLAGDFTAKLKLQLDSNLPSLAQVCRQ